MRAAETTRQKVPVMQATQDDFRFINVTLNVIGGKWTIAVLRTLFTGPKRFSEILKSMERVSSTMLSNRLRELEDEGIVDRIVYPVVPPHVEYSLTEKGSSLKPLLDKLSDWGEQWHLNS